MRPAGRSWVKSRPGVQFAASVRLPLLHSARAERRKQPVECMQTCARAPAGAGAVMDILFCRTVTPGRMALVRKLSTVG